MLLQEAIHSRRSMPVLGLPMPNEAQLDAVFLAAARAPDHRLLRPWRYLVLKDDGLNQLGQAFVDGMNELDPDRALRDHQRLLEMPLRAPMIVVAILSLNAHPTVPEWEQWLSLGAGVQNMLLTLHDQGFAGMWRTGDLVASMAVKSFLGLADHEQIAGFSYIGTAHGEKAAPALPNSIWQHWPQA
ncbi:MAG: nitroreductase [Moraxellaceae bacterium]|nr:nitroreductase [Moraxellaceae bacterium]